MIIDASMLLADTDVISGHVAFYVAFAPAQVLADQACGT